MLYAMMLRSNIAGIALRVVKYAGNPFAAQLFSTSTYID